MSNSAFHPPKRFDLGDEHDPLNWHRSDPESDAYLADLAESREHSDGPQYPSPFKKERRAGPRRSSHPTGGNPA